MPDFSDTVNLVYTDYKDNDVNPAAAFNGEDTPGFTVFIAVENIPQISPEDGQTTVCSLSVSFGDPNGGQRVGKTFHYGPEEFEVPEDGTIVAMLSVGYLGNDTFGLLGAGSAVIPSGLADSTVAAYFNPGNSGSSVTSGTIYVFAPEPYTPVSGGGNPSFNDRPRNLRLDSFSYDEINDDMEFTFSFDFDNTLGEFPAGFQADGFSIKKEDANGVLSNFSPVTVGTPIPWTGATHYTYTNEIGNWSIQDLPFKFYVIVGQDAVGWSTGPGSDVITIGDEPSPEVVTTLPPSAPMEQQLSPVILVGDVSGIYTLVEDKRVDTLYLRLPFQEQQETQDVQIPDPYVKTGFFP